MLCKIIQTLTDNLNRAISNVRTALNKCKSKLGVLGSVSFNYDHLAIVGFSGLTEEETLELLLENDIEITDIETSDDLIIVYGNPQDFYAIKEVIASKLPNVEFEIDEISMLPKDKVTIEGEDLEVFNRLITMLEDIEDVQNVYHNVEL